MKLHVLSDLHLRYGAVEVPACGADIVVLAGDIDRGAKGVDWAHTQFPGQRVLYVLGNHEFYDADYEAVLDRCRSEARSLDIALLESDEAVIEGVRFLGTTLWTDFELEGPSFPAALAMRAANQQMSDFKCIRYRGGMLSAEATRALHMDARRWLDDRLAEPFNGKTVVVTHHLPHRASIHRQFHGDRLNPAFASHLSWLVRAPVNLWIHGHTHCSFDYDTGGTRVVCNPRGYGPSDLNPEFDPVLTVET